MASFAPTSTGACTVCATRMFCFCFKLLVFDHHLIHLVHTGFAISKFLLVSLLGPDVQTLPKLGSQLGFSACFTAFSLSTFAPTLCFFLLSFLSCGCFLPRLSLSDSVMNGVMVGIALPLSSTIHGGVAPECTLPCPI
jgi:hypothetical protein